MSQHILVVGATGNVGSTLVQLLAGQGVSVKAATRSPEKYAAQPGVTPVRFEYDEFATHASALEGVDRVFLIAKPMEAAPQKALIPLIDRAKAVGVKQIVFMTAMGVDQAEGTGMRMVEKHLIASGVPYTILRPNWFMQNFNHGFLLPALKQAGAIFVPAGDAKTSFIDTRDIAAVAAKTLIDPSHIGKEYTLTGGEALSYAEAATMLASVSGRDIRYVAISDDDLRNALAHLNLAADAIEFMIGLFYVARQGWTAPVSPVVASVLGRAPISFEAFAREYAAVWK